LGDTPGFVNASLAARPTPLQGFGLRLPGPFSPGAGAGSHLARLSAAPLWSLLLLFPAFT